MNNLTARFITGGILFCAYGALLHVGISLYLGAFVAVALYAFFFEWLRLTGRQPVWLGWLSALVYFGVPFCGWFLIYKIYASKSLLLVAFPVIVTTACDTGAYLVGRFMGKHLAFPVLSPRKTYEGVVAGYVSVFCVNALYVHFFSGIAGFLRVVVVYPCGTAFVIASASILGDLFISRLKRRANLKDSGRVLPGHGGVLDRIGSLIFVFSFIAILALLDR